MSISLRAHVFALTAMCGTGVAAPAAAYVANQPAPRAIHARAQLDPVMDVSEQALAEAPYIEVIERAAITTTVAVEPWKPTRWNTSSWMGAQKASLPPAPAKLSGDCYTHRSQTLASGSVRVCDMKRSANGQGRVLLEPINKPGRLAPRFLSSPTGLTR